MNVRNLAVLFIAQMISVSGSVMNVQLAGVIGTGIAPSSGLATLPLSIMVIGTAVATIPAALLMQRIGRRLGFSVGALIGCLALLVSAWAVSTGSFALFCIGTGAFGLNLAFVQQYRFAAAESVNAERVSVAVSIVLLGSIGGALVGPRVVSLVSGAQLSTPYAVSYAVIAGLSLLSAIMIALTYRNTMPVAKVSREASRSMYEMVRVGGFLVAVAAGVTGYGVMTLIMTATPISMHVVDGHSMEQTGWVITSHVLAMYLPSLFSGLLIVRFGCRLIMVAGALLLFASLLFGLQGHAVMHYWLALVALGVGWNFLYVGGTTLLTRYYRPDERFRAQAFNDFSVFGASALASLVSGSLIHQLGWNWLLIAPMPLLILIVLGLLLLRRARTD